MSNFTLSRRRLFTAGGLAAAAALMQSAGFAERSR